MVFDLDDVAKIYGNNWLFTGISLRIDNSEILGIKGSNGSGKSTLLKILLDFITPTKGSIRYECNGKILKEEEINQAINFVAPYADPPLDLRINEFLGFHTHFKPFIQGITRNDFLHKVELLGHEEKALRDLSTGMLQRLKLGMAFLTQSHAILLDEPTSNLDEYYRNWFASLVADRTDSRTVVIASNDAFDWNLTDRIIDLKEYSI